MAAFSLEDEDYEGLFITQSDRVLNGGNVSENSSESMDVAEHVAGTSSQNSVIQPIYSDISDDDFDIPSSQMSSQSTRYVNNDVFNLINKDEELSYIICVIKILISIFFAVKLQLKHVVNHAKSTFTKEAFHSCLGK